MVADGPTPRCQVPDGQSGADEEDFQENVAGFIPIWIG